MKKIWIAAIAALSVTAFNASAQNDNNATAPQAQQCTGCAQQCGGCNHQGHRHHGQGQQRPDLFKGIDLTAEQQASIATLRQQRKAAINTAQADRPSRQQMQEARKAARENFMNGVKEILTPEQYTVFEQNVQNASQTQSHKKKHGRKHDNRHDQTRDPRTQQRTAPQTPMQQADPRS